MSSTLRVCIVNAARVDFDGRISFEKLSTLKDVEITVCNDSSPSPREVADRAEAQHILITKEIPIDVELLPSSVQLICEAGTGFNNIDVVGAAARGITVCNVPSYSTDAVAQLVITFMLSLSASLTQQASALTKGDKGNFTNKLNVPHFELNGKTIGLVGGNGSIGRRVAEIASVLGMRVIVWSRSATTCDLWEAVSFDELLKQSDFISIHCPLNPQTQGLFNSQAFERMKPTAYLINTARGGIVDEAALIDALTGHIIAGAALDVQGPPEPPLDSSPLYTSDNVILTPHIGWKRLETRQRLMDSVAENVQAFLRGNPTNVVNPSS